MCSVFYGIYEELCFHNLIPSEEQIRLARTLDGVARFSVRAALGPDVSAETKESLVRSHISVADFFGKYHQMLNDPHLYSIDWILGMKSSQRCAASDCLLS
jgi:hypothetical protein